MNNNPLDNLEYYKKTDPSDMLRHIHDIPALCHRACTQAQELALPQDYRDINNVVILGMGGSAIGGDLLASLVIDECKVPIMVHRSYNPPAFVDDKTLVIASSYSGTTEETLSAFKPLIATNAKKLVMTSGGEIGKLAQERGIPAFIFDYKSPPRAAMPLSFMALLGITSKLGLITDKSADIEEACNVVRDINAEINETINEQNNYAKQIARRLFGNIAVIYGAEHLSEVASRWKIQINENAKAWSINAAFPELNHNTTTGYEFPTWMSQKTLIIMLRSESLHPRVELRYGITGDINNRAGIRYEIVDARGKSKLAQMMSLVLMGDYVSYYMALLYGVDPYPIRAVEYLKAELGKNP
jgi:glucose/mannose-6-phosphate isomerase